MESNNSDDGATNDEVKQVLSNKIIGKRKVSKVKKVSKKKKKRANTRDMLGNNVLGDDKKDAQERQLEKLVFGGESDVLEHLAATVPTTKKRKSEAAEEFFIDRERTVSQEEPGVLIKSKKRDQSKLPAWEDEDDDNILVSEKIETYKKCHRSMSQKGSQKYLDVAREKFLKIAGTPHWADMEKRGVTADSDEDSEEELLQKTGNFLLKSSSLSKTTLDIRKCQNLTEPQLEAGLVKSVEFHPTAKVALVAGYSGTATLYQVDGKTNPKIQSVHFKQFPISSAHFSTNGNEIIVGSKDFGHFFTYDMICGKINKVPWEKGMEQMNVKRFHMSPDGKFMVVHGRYGNIHLLSARTKEWIGSLKMNGEVIAITFNRSGSQMYSYGGTGEVYIWDMESRKCIHKFVDEGSITGTSIAHSPNDQYLACGSDSGVVNIYECSNVCSTRNPKPTKVVMNLTTEITNMKFNYTSEILAMASSFKLNALKLVHFPSMTVFSNFPIKEKNLGYINSLDISLNSGYLMLGNNKGKVYLYRLRHYANY